MKLLHKIGFALMAVSGAILALPTGGVTVPANIMSIAAILGAVGTASVTISKGMDTLDNLPANDGRNN
jgi:hypothetical protein